MSRVLLMNSAVIPQPGRYTARQVSREEWLRVVRDAQREGRLVSYIGYPQNLEILAGWGIRGLQVSRAKATVRPGDIMAVMRLKYRVTDPRQKGRFTPRPEDFEFLLVYCE